MGLFDLWRPLQNCRELVNMVSSLIRGLLLSFTYSALIP